MKLPRWVSVFISMSIRYYCISVGRHARGFLGIPGHLGTVPVTQAVLELA